MRNLGSSLEKKEEISQGKFKNPVLGYTFITSKKILTLCFENFRIPIERQKTYHLEQMIDTSLEQRRIQALHHLRYNANIALQASE